MRISEQDVIRIHDQAIAIYGGSYGVRDMNEVKSVINNIYLTFGGEELYPTVEDKASFLAFGLIKNHAFIDGNKRVGVNTMITFLEMNGYQVQATNEEMIDFGLAVATSKMDQSQIVIWIKEHTVKSEMSSEAIDMSTEATSGHQSCEVSGDDDKSKNQTVVNGNEGPLFD